MKRKLVTVFAVVTLALTACNTTDNNGQNNGDGTNVEPTRYNQNNTGDGFTNNRNSTFERNFEGTGLQGNDRFSDNDRVNDENFTRNDRNNNNRNNNNNDNRYDVAEAADRITDEISEIDRAYVLTTDNNAYVAAQLDTNENDARIDARNRGNNIANNRTNNDNGEELTDEVKEQIADIVKSVDNDIDNVFVSTNPDFYNLTNNYIDDTDNGRPVRGFFDQMGNMIERLFPQNR